MGEAAELSSHQAPAGPLPQAEHRRGIRPRPSGSRAHRTRSGGPAGGARPVDCRTGSPRSDRPHARVTGDIRPGATAFRRSSPVHYSSSAPFACPAIRGSMPLAGAHRCSKATPNANARDPASTATAHLAPTSNLPAAGELPPHFTEDGDASEPRYFRRRKNKPQDWPRRTARTIEIAGGIRFDGSELGFEVRELLVLLFDAVFLRFPEGF